MLISTILRSWYALLIFLIYVGGIIIIFSYFIALSPNQTLKIKDYIKIIIITIIAFIPIIIYITNKFIVYIQFIKAYDLYLINIKYVTIILILILLIILLIIVKLVKISAGPLRPFKYV